MSVTGREATHWEGCWQLHDDCALVGARRVLEADQSSALLRGLLIVVDHGIRDHAAGECCAAPGDCVAIEVARRVISCTNLGQVSS